MNNNVNKSKSQLGISSLGLLVVLALAGLGLLSAFKLGPLYLDNYFIRGAINSMAKENIDEMSEGQIRRKLSDYFTVNNIRDVDTKAIKVERDKKGTRIILNYEKRVDFLGNVDVVVSFENRFDTAGQ